ncbi:MAG TPA: SPOR domain-containing protein [bacterium]
MHIFLCLLFTYHPVVYDSTVYCIDIAHPQVMKISLDAEIIDYAVDDFLYVLTQRRLFKVSLPDLQIVGRVPLPIRFNCLTTGPDEIILIATEEIILVDKKNLSFRSGIGIEPGDYRPLVAPVDLAGAGKSDLIYLAMDHGEHTIFKIFDLNSGRLVKAKQVSNVISSYYDLHAGTIVCLDRTDNLSTYNLNLKRLHQTKVPVHAAAFSPYPKAAGYLFYNTDGIFWIGKDGTLNDFQPVFANDNMSFSNFHFLTRFGLLYVNPLTLRPQWLRSDPDLTGIAGIKRTTPLDDLSSAGFTRSQSVYLLSSDTTLLMPLVENWVLPLPPPVVMVPGNDSLWYIQFAAFSKPENASAALERLVQQDIPAIIDSMAPGFYRIKLGGFMDNDLGRAIMENTGMPGWLVYQAKVPSADSAWFSIGPSRYLRKNGVVTLAPAGPDR